MNLHNKVISYDDRRDLIIPGNAQETVEFCAKQFIQIGNEAIYQRGFYTVALSGGSTPKAIFQLLSKPPYAEQLDWNKVLVFWSDERSVGPDDPESNYKMAMTSGLEKLPIKKENIFRMKAESNIEDNAEEYEKKILEMVPNGVFDLLMLGMGDDSHTASLFPHTVALHVVERLVVPNEVPQKATWRMTLTYTCINQARHIVIYVIGKNKAETVAKVLQSNYDPETFPVQAVGTKKNKALWILDRDAASKIS